MRPQRQKKAAMGTRLTVQKPDRFTPLLADIRRGLGEHWTFYEECIDGVLDAAANQKDTTAWFEQMQQIVEGTEKVTFSHEGILFLLQDMSIRPLKQQSWGDTRMFPSPPLSPLEELSEMPPSFVDGISLLTLRPHSSMSSILPLMPLRPNASAVADWPAPHAPSHTQQQQLQQPQQHQPQAIRDGVLPFDFSAPVQPGLTFPKDLRTFHYPPDQIIITEGCIPNPMKEYSSNPILFSDLAMRVDVAEEFGYTTQSKNNNRNDNGVTVQTRQRLPYNPKDDDLMAWRMRSKPGADDGDKKVKANGSVTDAWPPWNFRFDLDL